MLLTDYEMLDAAELPLTWPETDVWAGYVGGAADNIWSNEDWQRVARYPKLPIWVADKTHSGSYWGLGIVIAAYNLGIPRGTAVAIDMELVGADGKANLEDCGKCLHYFGYYAWPYGSTSYLFQLPPLDGYWVSTDSKMKQQYAHPNVHATQWDFGSLFDSSLIHRHAVHAHLASSWGVNAG